MTNKNMHLIVSTDIMIILIVKLDITTQYITEYYSSIIYIYMYISGE